MAEKFADVEGYLDALPQQTRTALEQVRRRIHEAVPGAGEKISYNIPAVTVGGRAVVYFAGYPHHVSVYPLPDGDERLLRAIAPYVAGKGTLRFPLDEPIPLDLVAEVAVRLAAPHA
jgi:uncharacterized protein YdhG (YjbR/CyaY superfamily)